VPERPGGGTVDYVAACQRLSVDYTRHLEEREEGGTPAILGDIRAGIAFLVKDMVGAEEIREHEVRLSAQAVERLSRNPRIRLLGPMQLPRLAILSFNVEGLHHDLVSALLDHLFGIQNRAGCSCAGPYGHRLLDIDRPQSEAYRKQIAVGILGIKPGWVRLSLPYYASSEDIDFILKAVEFVADHGREFVPAYRLGWRDGVWRCLDGACQETSVPLSLSGLRDAMRGAVEQGSDHLISEEELREERARYLAEAHRLAAELRQRWKANPPAWNSPCGRPDIDALIWFHYVHADDGLRVNASAL
jgi:hypothetical protein